MTKDFELVVVEVQRPRREAEAQGDIGVRHQLEDAADRLEKLAQGVKRKRE